MQVFNVPASASKGLQYMAKEGRSPAFKYKPQELVGQASL